MFNVLNILTTLDLAKQHLKVTGHKKMALEDTNDKIEKDVEEIVHTEDNDASPIVHVKEFTKVPFSDDDIDE